MIIITVVDYIGQLNLEIKHKEIYTTLPYMSSLMPAVILNGMINSFFNTLKFF